MGGAVFPDIWNDAALLMKLSCKSGGCSTQSMRIVRLLRLHLGVLLQVGPLLPQLLAPASPCHTCHSASLCGKADIGAAAEGPQPGACCCAGSVLQMLSMICVIGVLLALPWRLLAAPQDPLPAASQTAALLDEAVSCHRVGQQHGLVDGLAQSEDVRQPSHCTTTQHKGQTSADHIEQTATVSLHRSHKRGKLQLIQSATRHEQQE